MHDYFVKNVIDFTPGAGTLALTCVKQHVGYLGVCMSEQHQQGLRSVLIDGILSAMTEENSGLYQPRLAKAMGDTVPESKGKPAKAQAKASAAAGGKGPQDKKTKPGLAGF